MLSLNLILLATIVPLTVKLPVTVPPAVCIYPGALKAIAAVVADKAEVAVPLISIGHTPL